MGVSEKRQNFHFGVEYPFNVQKCKIFRKKNHEGSFKLNCQWDISRSYEHMQMRWEFLQISQKIDKM